MNKHSKGPWRYDGHGVNSVEGERICKPSYEGPYSGDNNRLERYDADCNLIASAPELLEACKLALDEIEKAAERFATDKETWLSYEALKNAIVKAEGREV